MSYISALEPENEEELEELKRKMKNYYTGTPYHDEYISGINSGWETNSHRAQIKMCDLIPSNADVLEVGCGDGAAAREIDKRTESVSYTGIDLNPAAWPDDSQYRFVKGDGENLPFEDAEFDVVLSMFAIEHMIYPHRHLDEGWRVLKPGGSILTIAPDFSSNGMASEGLGRTYGSGHEKLVAGQIKEAFLTLINNRLRIPLKRYLRRRRLRSGEYFFPVLLTPRCLEQEGFTPDCDAVYPVDPTEVINYLEEKSGFCAPDIFYRDSSTFGLQVEKKEK